MTIQLTLFDEAPPPTITRRGPHELATSPELLDEVLAVFASRPHDWIGYGDKALRAIKHRHDLGSHFSAAIHRLLVLGHIEERNVYHGAERPGDPHKPYLGYSPEYRLRDLRAIRCTINMLKWRRLDPTSYLYGQPISTWYEGVIRENLHQAGGLMGKW